jgi:acyl-CoA synthetase (AMP-forming)/AMP-acid ligase II
MTNLAANLADTTRAHADRTAVRVGDATMTYRELGAVSAAVAGLLRERGLKPGDRVGIMLPNRAGPREEAGSPPRAGQRSNPTERRHRLRGTALAI